MIVFFIILAVLLLALGLQLFLPMEFDIEIIKTEKRNDTFVRASIFAIPIKVHLSQRDVSIKKQKRKQTKRQLFSYESFKERLSDFKEIYDTSKDELKQMLSYARHHTSVKCVDFDIRFGFNNAAVTGISTGAIWGMGSFILKVIDTLVGIKKINMNVNPDFDNKIFEIYSKTILIMKPIHLIMIVRQVLKTYKYVNNKLNK